MLILSIIESVERVIYQKSHLTDNLLQISNKTFWRVNWSVCNLTNCVLWIAQLVVVGVCLGSDWWTRVATLNLTHCHTGNQCFHFAVGITLVHEIVVGQTLWLLLQVKLTQGNLTFMPTQDSVASQQDLIVARKFNVHSSRGVRTLRTQDISALVPKCLGHFGTTITLYDEKSDYVNFIPFR